jgi:STE24 endopeptidase
MGSKGLRLSLQASDGDAGRTPTGSKTHPAASHSRRVKKYHRTKITISIVSSLLSFFLLVILVVTDASRDLAMLSRSISTNPYVALAVFGGMVGLLQAFLTLPLRWYAGFFVEHRYGLSNQSFRRWLGEGVKGLLVGAPIMLVVLLVLYFALESFDGLWWLPVGAVVTLLTVILARIGPVLIMPLFYKFTPVEDGSLRDRITKLCSQAGVRIGGVFSFDLSKNTRKANAAFAGIGRAKRIILGDTLVRKFTEEEIEAVFAHELGHLVFHHIRSGMILGTVSTFAGLCVASYLYTWSVHAAGFSSITDLAALPLLAIWLGLFGLLTSPLGNVISRYHERQADAYAVKTTGGSEPFVSALRKLARMNLADPEPHPLVEFLFYSHPPVAKRIRAAASRKA